MNCVKCGAPIENGVCSYCGAVIKVKPVPVEPPPPQPSAINVKNETVYVKSKPIKRVVTSPKNRGVAGVLCLLFGYAGFHRFYLGKSGSGLLYLFTFGVFGIGWVFDLILIAFGEFQDGNGLYLK